MRNIVTIWNEFRHEKLHEETKRIYPSGIHNIIAEFTKKEGFKVKTATLDEPDHGLSDEVLNSTGVLVWWSHMANEEVRDDIVEKIHKRILEGMGFIALHSSHLSKIFKKLMGTSCRLKWREEGEKERVWVVEPGHPIAEGLPEYFEIPHSEMYGERFDIPRPDELVFISWFKGGEVFRSGMCFYRGNGRIFYFSPGHETYPIYYQEEVQKVICNAVRWAMPRKEVKVTFGNVKPLEKLE